MSEEKTVSYSTLFNKGGCIQKATDFKYGNHSAKRFMIRFKRWGLPILEEIAGGIAAINTKFDPEGKKEISPSGILKTVDMKNEDDYVNDINDLLEEVVDIPDIGIKISIDDFSNSDAPAGLLELLEDLGYIEI